MRAPGTGPKPKILFISTASTIGGGEIYLANLLPALKPKYDCTVLGRPPILGLLKDYGAVHRIRLFPEWAEKTLKRSYRIKKLYYRIYFRGYFKKNHYEIVNLQEFDGAFVEAIDFRPIILTELTRLFVPEDLKVWARGLFQKIDRVICVSDQTLNDITSLQIPNSKCVVIHNGVDTNKFKTSSKTGAYVTWIGRLEEIDKNPMLFVKIAETAQVQGFDYKFRMVGDGSAMKTIKKYVKEHDIKNLELTGYWPSERMLDIYHQAVILCMTSKTEGLPFAVLEAMACGKPVVAANVGGLGEIIDSPSTGSLIDGFDKNKYLEKISSILDDPKLYKQMSAASRNRIERKFSTAKMVDSTIQQYDDLLKEYHG